MGMGKRVCVGVAYVESLIEEGSSCARIGLYAVSRQW